MSRLTASPFHKPSPFQFPRAPPSPPDTNSDTIIPGMPIPMLSAAQSLSGQDFGVAEGGLASASPDTPGSRLRKSSSIPYHSSGFRENKDRTSQRGGKPLIIVIPPPTLFQVPGQHGPTIASGPYHRLTQGVVMPLFPSMFGQLTAIAREFNFPSTSGLCLYFHYVEDGLTLTPRISDDSWQSLWGHLSEPLFPNERRPLIGGKIEFDIDHRLARWYAAWISSIHREISDASHYYPFTAPSLGHFRAESRTTTTDGRPFDDDVGDNSVIHQHSAPITRHVPRKLSLVERFETSSARPDIKPNPRSLGSQPEIPPSGSQALSPIVQEDEPKTAKQDLNSRVKSWRASAHLNPTPLAATGQTSLEPPNLPNGMLLDPSSSLEVDEEELKMEDFTWSVSSAGPQSSGEVSPVSWGRVPSVHLDSRLEGSVCSTPSIQTSFGPSDSDPFSPASPFARIPSPDIAQRFYEDVPDTPLTATSWGAPLSYPPSPPPTSSFARVPSPDIAQRFYEDVPDTPLTATTWGAPLSYPPSPRCFSPVPSLDLGERARFDDFEPTLHYPRSLEPTSQASSEIWPHVWPYNIGHSNLSSSSTYLSKEQAGANDQINGIWPHVWPYNIDHSKLSSSIDLSHEQAVASDQSRGIWPHVWPYNIDHSKLSSTSTYLNDEQTVANSQSDGIWHHVWPYNTDHSKLSSSSAELSDEQAALYDQRNGIWPHVWPYNGVHSTSTTTQVDSSTRSTFGYPYINIYHPVYPHLDIYPLIPAATQTSSSGEQVANVGISLVVRLPSVYPTIKLYADVYPHNLSSIYPSVPLPQESSAPHADADAYPHNLDNIYPAVTQLQGGVIRDIDAHVYPHNLDFIYPPIHTGADGYPHNLDQIYPHGSGSQGSIQHTEIYPFFNLYPPTMPPFFAHLSLHMCNPRSQYPDFEIYPEIPTHTATGRLQGLPRSLTSSTPEDWLSGSVYPAFNLYPAVYPFFDLYPSVETRMVSEIDSTMSSTDHKQPLKTTLQSHYPVFDLYPAVYPYFDIYPASTQIVSKAAGRSDQEHVLTTTMPTMYPFFNLYPSVYPYLDIYPAPHVSSKNTSFDKVLNEDKKQALAHTLAPMILLSTCVNPCVYPHFDIYSAAYVSSKLSNSSLAQFSKDERRVPTSTSAQAYPFFNLYPSVYPYFDIYPALNGSSTLVAGEVSRKVEPISIRAVARYPIFNLYPAVYPCFDLYLPRPEPPVFPMKAKAKSTSRLTHAELHAMVMMERIGSTGSFRPTDGLRESRVDVNRQMSFINEEDETASCLEMPTASSSSSRIPISSSSQTHEVRKPSMALQSGSSSSLQSMSQRRGPSPLHPSSGFPGREISRSTSPREQPKYGLPPRPSSIVQGHDLSRSSSLRDQPIPRSSHTFPLKVAPRRRDSLVLQRAKAYDTENTSGLVKDTIAKFPLPPKIPLPPLPTDRGK
ncbi:hypothetical protein BDZ97DRAFT_1911708 [Flammula alnicola]|nr:hypothetical protein BDZ97DRAFT_1911708 [Flammula alnicola]